MSILYIRDELNERWLPCVSEIDALPDVYVADGVLDGHVLMYDDNSGSPRWSSGSLAAGGGTSDVQSLDDLDDVTAGSPANNQILQFNESSGQWEAVSQSGSAGDMYKSVYDQNDDGVVDDSERLGNQLPSYYSPATHDHNDVYYTKPDLKDSSGSGQVHWDNVTNTPSTYAPSAHNTSHENNGSDEISVAGLSGVLADAQNANKLLTRDLDTVGTPADGQVMVWRTASSKWMYEDQTGGSGGDGGSSGSGFAPVWEDLTSQVPDVADHFDTSYTFELGTLAVFYNGIQQQMSKVTEDGDGGGFTTLFSPVSGDKLVAFYHREVGGVGPDTIAIKEQDASPALSGIHTLIVGNGDLSDEGSGFARLLTAADVTIGPSDQDVLMMQIFS